MTKPSYVHAGIAHFDIAGDDCGALGKFYSDVLGWNVQSRGAGYSSIETPEGSANGAIVEAPERSVTIGVTVSDLEACLARAVESGGQVVMPATDNGWVKKAQIADTAGNVVSLIQM